jgi:error-prone DNA polymerase
MGIARCANLKAAQDGSRVTVSGLVLVRQMPGSAKGVMCATIEDESDVANLIIWPSLFEEQRRVVLSAGMLGVRGKVQRESDVMHVIAEHLLDLSAELLRVSNLEGPFPLVAGRGDGVRHSGGADSRDPKLGRKPRDIYVPDLHIESIRVRTRDFR